MASGSPASHAVLPPEQNAEPSPVTTTARTDRSAASSSTAAAQAAVISSDIALRWSGLSSTSSATPSEGLSTRRWTGASAVPVGGAVVCSGMSANLLSHRPAPRDRRRDRP